MKKLFLFVSLFLVPTSFADSGLEFANDVLNPHHHDRWYTNGVRVFHGDFALGMSMYTPRDKRNAGIPYGDRPWDGYLYGEYNYKLNNSKDIKFRLGALGAASFQKNLQRYFHNDLGLGIDPKGWDTQNPSELAVESLYDHRYSTLFDSWVGWVRAETSYGGRVGNVVDSIFLQSDVRRGFVSHNFQLYGLAGTRGEAVAFNTHLDGRMFHGDTYSVNSIPFVASVWLGVGAELYRWNVEYQYVYLTQEAEFQGQDRHLYGTITIKRIW